MAQPTIIKRSHLVNWLRQIDMVCTATLKVKTRTKIGKSSSLYQEFGEIYKEATIVVLLNWHKDQATLDLLEAANVPVEGQKWQNNEETSPLATHKDTGKYYLRVLPVNQGKQTVCYVTANNIVVPANKVEATLYPAGRKDITNLPVHFLYSLDSIEEVEIEGERFIIK